MSTLDTARPADTTATTAPHDQADAKRWWVLAVLGIAQLMVVLDTTVVNIALHRPSGTWASATRIGSGW